MINLSIIIPCYNESESLYKLIEFCKDSIKNRNDIDFVIVNNGSTDETKSILESFTKSPEYKFLKSINISKNIGYGNGILQGLYDAEGRILAWTHADLQTDPKDVIEAYDIYKNDLLENKCIVKGKRINRNIFDQFFTSGMSFISSYMLNAKLDDVNAQPKIFNKIFLDDLRNAPIDFSLDLYFLYQAKKANLIIYSHEVNFNKRIFGEAKGGGTFKGKFKLIRRTFKYIVKLRKDIKNGKR